MDEFKKMDIVELISTLFISVCYINQQQINSINIWVKFQMQLNPVL